MKARRRSHQRDYLCAYVLGWLLLFLIYTGAQCRAAPMENTFEVGARSVSKKETSHFFSVLEGDPEKHEPWELHARAGDGLARTLSDKKISDNLLPRPISVVPTAGMVQATDNALYIAGLDARSNILLFRMDNNGRKIWSQTIGGASSSNQVLALTLDSSENVYIGGHLALGLPDSDEDAAPGVPSTTGTQDAKPAPSITGTQDAKPVVDGSASNLTRAPVADSIRDSTVRQKSSVKANDGAFVACLNWQGKRQWTKTYGSAASGDIIRSMAVGPDGTIYAGGSAGESSPLFMDKAKKSDTRRPVLMGLDKATGVARYTLFPESIEKGKDEEITAVAVDGRNGAFVFAGGSFDGKSGTLYKFEGKNIRASYKMQMSTAITAISTSQRRANDFIVVGGCFLNRVTNKGTKFVEYPLQLRDMDGDKECYGDAVDVAYRKTGNDAVVLMEGFEDEPEVLLYSDRLRGIIGRVSGDKKKFKNYKGLIHLSDDTVVFTGQADSGGAYIGGAVIKQNSALVKAADEAATHQKQDMGLFVKLAAIGGSGIVIVGGLLTVVIIVQYNKRTGEPA